MLRKRHVPSFLPAQLSNNDFLKAARKSLELDTDLINARRLLGLSTIKKEVKTISKKMIRKGKNNTKELLTSR